MKFSAVVGPTGGPRPHNLTGYMDWLKRRRGQRIEIELRDEAAIRSNRQNRYWFGVVVQFFRDEWEREGHVVPRDVVHDVLVRTFADIDETKTPLGNGRRSTRSMTVAEFSKLIDTVGEYALHKYGATIPTPEEWSE